jgi:hypothetical protein
MTRLVYLVVKIKGRPAQTQRDDVHWLGRAK